MFGVIKGCGCHFTPAEKQAWVGHVCGLCLSLRDGQGQVARLATNYDAALLSVLCEAQSAAPLVTTSHVCPLRGFQRAEVVTSANAGSQYAAAIASLMAGTKVNDHLADGETALRHLPGAAAAVSRRWLSAGRQAAAKLGFASERIEAQTGRQAAVEQEHGRDFFYYAQPTELAVAAAFSHTAVLAGCPQNATPLYEVGRMFGRIMYLLDSYRDEAADRAAGHFNALAQAFDPADIQQQAQHIFRQAHRHLSHSFNQLSLPHPGLARTLLVDQLKREGLHTISGQGGACLTAESGRKRASCWAECFGDCCTNGCIGCCEGACDCCTTNSCCDCGELCCNCDCCNCDCCDCGSCCDCNCN